MDGSTAWEGINQAMVLARRPEPRSESLDRLRPATNIEFRNELTACLVLVAPVGMTEEARGEWLRVAWETLKHLPADVLAIGCRKARATCDHPSKIVPTILSATDTLMAQRRTRREPIDPPQLPKPVPPPLTDDEIRTAPEWVIEMGIKLGEIDPARAKSLRVGNHDNG